MCAMSYMTDHAEALQTLLPFLVPCRNTNGSPKTPSCERWLLEGCCGNLAPENWLVHLGKQGKGPGIPSAISLPMKRHRKGVRRKGESSRDRNCEKQPFLWENSNLVSWLENQAQKAAGFLYFGINTQAAQRHFSSNLSFSCYLKDLSEFFFLWFKQKKKK